MQSLLLKLTIWFCTEVLLTCLSLDDLADYGEYILRLQDGLSHSQDVLII